MLISFLRPLIIKPIPSRAQLHAFLFLRMPRQKTVAVVLGGMRTSRVMSPSWSVQ
jgi:hypothetical protein